ncbi:MAG: YdiY family protein [Bryobacteraceae bacterium]
MARSKSDFRFFLLVSVWAVQGCWADQVTLKNGDRVTGSIVKKDGATLTIKSEAMGVVTVPWDQVATIQSDKPLNVVLPDGKSVQATLAASEGKVELKETRQSLTPAEVITIRDSEEQAAYERMLHPPFSRLWAGTATLGFAGTQGNAQTRTFTVAMNAARATSTDKVSLYFNAVKASALINRVSADTAQAVRGGWGYNRTVSSRLFINTFNDYEYDRFQNLDLRFVLGGGLGYNPWKGEHGRLDVVGGAAYNREKFSPPSPDPAFSRSSAEAYWGEDFSYKLSDATSLVQGFRMFNNLSETGAYRMNFDLGANTRLLKWLTWNLGFSNRYLSNPVPGRKKNDILYTTGIGVTFSR